MGREFIKRFFSIEEQEKFQPDILKFNAETQNNKGNSKLNIAKSISENKSHIKEVFSECIDLKTREISLFNSKQHKAMLVYLSEFSQPQAIDKIIISKFNSEIDMDIELKDMEETIKYMLGIEDENVYEDFNKCIKALINGKIVIFVDSLCKGFVIDLKEIKTRGIEEPNTEGAIRGPREGFVEDINTNISLIRRIIKNENLKIEKTVVGKESNSDIVICYIKNIADERIVDEVKARIKNININLVLDSNNVLEAIEDDKWGIMPTIFRTERPDVAASKILEGKVVIIVDGSPNIMSVPALFVEFMQAADDYYIKYFSASLNRLFRYLAFAITVMLPSIYVALLDFHQELLPTKLAISVIKSRAGVPFPAPVECFIMLFAYDIMREAGLRIPKSLGQTVSIVGALIIGEAAVRAGLVGAPMIIVVAFTGTSLFTIPSPELSMVINLVKYFFLILSTAFGIIGLTNGIIFLLMYMISIRSFGIPYMYPIAPLCLKRNKDSFIRFPINK